MSTNKVYGDRPNTLALAELRDPVGIRGCGVRNTASARISIDQSTHSLFGASKVASRRAGAGVRPLLRHADLLPARRMSDRSESRRRRAARLPELSHQVQRAGPRVQRVRVQGQAGSRQHSRRGRGPLHVRVLEGAAVAEVYNLGGGKGNSCSILEAFSLAERTPGGPCVGATSTSRESAITFVITAICARCARTIPGGPLPGPSTPSSRRSPIAG